MTFGNNASNNQIGVNVNTATFGTLNFASGDLVPFNFRDGLPSKNGTVLMAEWLSVSIGSIFLAQKALRETDDD